VALARVVAIVSFPSARVSWGSFASHEPRNRGLLELYTRNTRVVRGRSTHRAPRTATRARARSARGRTGRRDRDRARAGVATRSRTRAAKKRDRSARGG
jgi:hypothetical protein